MEFIYIKFKRLLGLRFFCSKNSKNNEILGRKRYPQINYFNIIKMIKRFEDIVGAKIIEMVL